MTPIVEFENDLPAGEAGIKASPVASAIIADKKIDPKTVTHQGLGGKILKEDVLAALANPVKGLPGMELLSRECT